MGWVIGIKYMKDWVLLDRIDRPYRQIWSVGRCRSRWRRFRRPFWMVEVVPFGGADDAAGDLSTVCD